MGFDTIETALKQPIKLGPITTIAELPEFARMTFPDIFVGVTNPLGGSKPCLKNIHDSSAHTGDDHRNATTGRDLIKGDACHVTHEVLYMRPEDLRQTGRNLVLQQQMIDSPIWAIPTENGMWQAIDRINGVESRRNLFPILWGVPAYFDIFCDIEDSGGVLKIWAKNGSLPDLSQPPIISKTGDTYQGRNAHHTIGQYSQHSSPGVYIEHIGIFARGRTAEEARRMAGPPIFSGGIVPVPTPEPTPTPTKPTQAQARAAIETLKQFVG